MEKVQEVVGLFQITIMVKNIIIHPSLADGMVILIKEKLLLEKPPMHGFGLNGENK